MKLAHLLIAATLSMAWGPLSAQGTSPRILQLYSYRLSDPARFRAGYRAHLEWHEQHRDPLVWYAWTVDAGPRRGQLIDGTAGATLAELDARPDLPGDGANFAATVGDSVQPVDTETWALWTTPTTAPLLEEHKPSANVDVFLLTVAPGRAATFERLIEGMARHRRATGPKLAWYRRLRGGAAAGYMIVVARSDWAGIDTDGGTPAEILSRAYSATSAAASKALSPVEGLATETWSFEAQLSSFPGNRVSG